MLVSNIHNFCFRALPVLISLNLVSRLNSVESTKIDVKKWYPQLFNGLGQFEQEYEVSLKESAKPFALHTARNIPLPLRSKVQNELKCMESFFPVCSPSLWCASMVVVPKPSGKVINLKHLNKSVQKEYHPLSCVEETLAQLSGAQVFTKLDTNKRVLADPSHQRLTLIDYLHHTIWKVLL